MAGMGPPPKAEGERRRRNPTIAMTRLPAEGRQGETPPWPLAEDYPGELELWDQLWMTPQSVAWERLRWTREVACYVRYSILAEMGNMRAAPEARQLADRLGLTPLALLRLRWEIVSDEVAPRRETAERPARHRLKVVDRAVAGA